MNASGRTDGAGPGDWPGRARSALLVLAAGLGIGVFVWFVSGSLEPFAHPDRPLEYVFIGASPLILLATASVAIALLATGHARLARSINLDRSAGEGTAYLVPLALLGLAPLGALVLLPGAGTYLSVLAYVLVDLRVWWSLALIGTALARLERLRGWPLWLRFRRLLVRPGAGGRQFAIEAFLFLLVLLFAVVSARYLRFTAVLHGDEPTYIRYCENFYQGRGFDVGEQQPLDQLTLAYAPPLGRNLQLFVQGLREDLGFLGRDLRALAAGDVAMRFNRAQFHEGWFLRGRNGGSYQVHNPGLSFVLFPAYFIDRHFFATSAGYQDIFPTFLAATNFLVLLIWSIWSVVLYRLFRACTGSSGMALVLVVTAMLTMPVSAFGFQIYPEALAGLIVSAVFLWLLFRQPDAGPVLAAIAAGAAIGYLPWLHVRFILMSLVIAGWATVVLRRRRLAFAGAYGMVMLALCLYSYHLTGSFRPDAIYEAEGAYSAWRAAAAIESATADPLDRILGFLPHAPVYLFAIPGWIVALRKWPRPAILAALLIASLVIPSGGHGFSAAGATPLRHLVAVVPLAMIPMAAALMTYGTRPWVKAAFVILLIVSLDASVSYNLHHRKEVGRMIDHAVSGWAPNLLFPWTHAGPWAPWRGTFVLFLIWAALLASLLGLPIVRRSSGAAAPLTLRHLVVGIACFVLLATGATALGGEWTRSDYFVPLRIARAATIDFAAGLDRCRMCFSSTRGEVGRGSVVIDPAPVFDFQAQNDDVRAGEEVVFKASAVVPDGQSWGALAVDFGDDSTARIELMGSSELRHIYRATGVRRVTARFTPHGGAPVLRSVPVAVRDAAVDLEAVRELPEHVRRATVRGSIRQLMLGPGGFRVDVGEDLAAASPWLLQWTSDRWEVVPEAAWPELRAGAWVAVIGVGQDGSYRTPPVIVRQPDRGAIVGAPAILYASPTVKESN